MSEEFDVVDTYLAKAALAAALRGEAVVLHPEDSKVWHAEAPYLRLSTDPTESRYLTYMNVPVEVRPDAPRAAEALAKLNAGS